MELSSYINTPVKRRESRDIINEYYSVEVNLDDALMVNQYIIYDISSEGLCLLVREDEDLLEKIRVGEVYKMKYYPLNLLDNARYLKTEIRHIRRPLLKKYSGYYLVGLSIYTEGNGIETTYKGVRRKC